MELLIFRPADYAYYYNCSLIEVDSVPLEKRQNLLCGIIFIALFFLYEALYLPCILAIWAQIKNECYKMLLFIGIVDMLALCIIGFLTGVLAIEGAVFCSHPTLIYIAGCTTKALYNAEIIMEMILSVNRCLKILTPDIAEFLFAGNRTWIWCAATALINVYWFLFIKAVSFNSQFFNWFTNPFQGYGINFDKLYPPNINDIFENLRGYLVLFGLPIIYAVFCVAFLANAWRYREMSSATQNLPASNAEKKMLLQVFIIGAVNSITPLLYKFINFAPWAGNEIMMAAMFGWLHIHAAPPVIFLLFNKTIRMDVERRCRWLFSLKCFNITRSSSPHPNVCISVHNLRRVIPAAIVPAGGTASVNPLAANNFRHSATTRQT